MILAWDSSTGARVTRRLASTGGMPQRKGMRLTRTLPVISFLALSSLTMTTVQGCSSSEDDDGPASTGGAATGGAATGGESSGTGGAATGGDTTMTGGVGGEMSASGGDSGTGGSTSMRLPALLSETGLYEQDMQTLAPGVQAFRPQFPLWTDSAEKRRWIKLPDGEKIDTSDMNYWAFPVGTKLWKEFSRDGKVVETRLISKRRAPNIWDMVAYHWRDDMSEADAVPAGVMNASGTEHDIPSQEQCGECHNQMTDRVLGFSAVQLSHEGQNDEWTLDSLAAAELLTAPPAAPIVLGGTPEEIAALGYLHANCGHCHHPGSGTSGRVDMQLWLRAEEVGDLSTSKSVSTTVNKCVSLPEDTPEGASHRVSPNDLDHSAVYQRYNSVGEKYSMPPLGTEDIDPAGKEAIEEWISGLALASTPCPSE